jgi:hypothetical protein
VARSDVERPPLPAAIRFAIGLLAVPTIGVAGLLLRFGARAVEGRAIILIPTAGLLGWIVLAAAAMIGILRRKPRAWFTAATLMVASAALVAYPIVDALVRRGLPPIDRTLAILLALLASFLVPLGLLLAGRRAYLDLARQD